MDVHDHCCESMARRLEWSCTLHDDAFACPDALISFSSRYQEYGIIVHDGGTAVIGIGYCPWCGRRLPESQRDRWFDELEKRGIDPWEDDIPEEFQSDSWLRLPDGETGAVPGGAGCGGPVGCPA
ncbi:hypothetical protein AB0M28_00690 [Streptomyces sp. NPDC051940]|uniref:DUF6980 family protein n=1 Tax=Streptomyces sp. NPDC051940 TaxID=3155675 RepID=UPI0034353FDC